MSSRKDGELYSLCSLFLLLQRAERYPNAGSETQRRIGPKGTQFPSSFSSAFVSFDSRSPLHSLSRSKGDPSVRQSGGMPANIRQASPLLFLLPSLLSLLSQSGKSPGKSIREGASPRKQSGTDKSPRRQSDSSEKKVWRLARVDTLLLTRAPRWSPLDRCWRDWLTQRKKSLAQ